MELAERIEELKANIEKVEARIKLLQDVEDIKKLKARYGYSVDCQDYDAVMKCFAKECNADYGLFGKCNNRDEIEKWFRGTVPKAMPFCLHFIENPIIEVNGDRATGVWYFNVPLTNGETNEASWMTGKYEDVYIREDGKWKYKELKCTIYFLSALDKGWVKQNLAK